MNPQQQQQVAGLAAGFGFAVIFVYLLIFIFFAFLFWRIFTKAGMAGALGLIALIPGFGILICMCILAFGSWRVAPLPQGYASGPPSYPPTFPPASFSHP